MWLRVVVDDSEKVKSRVAIALPHLEGVFCCFVRFKPHEVQLGKFECFVSTFLLAVN